MTRKTLKARTDTRGGGKSNGKIGNGRAVWTEPGTNRFKKGNPGGPGNPYAAKTVALRAALLQCETPEHVAEVMGVLRGLALKGRSWAVKEYLNRTCGKVVTHIAVTGEGDADHPDLRFL